MSQQSMAIVRQHNGEEEPSVPALVATGLPCDDAHNQVGDTEPATIIDNRSPSNDNSAITASLVNLDRVITSSKEKNSTQDPDINSNKK